LDALLPLQRLRHFKEQKRPDPQLPSCGVIQTSHVPGLPADRGERLISRFNFGVDGDVCGDAIFDVVHEISPKSKLLVEVGSMLLRVSKYC